jgi:hypothetical protein
MGEVEIYLEEANIIRLLTEAPTANVKMVFPDQTMGVGANAAAIHEQES